jgi:anti-sigma B factor antagonist
MAMEFKADVRSVLIAFPAEIDLSNERDLRHQLITAILSPGVSVVIVDMTATKICDSMGIRALVLAHRRAVRHDVELRLLRPGQNVINVLKDLRLDDVLRVCDTFEEAASL